MGSEEANMQNVSVEDLLNQTIPYVHSSNGVPVDRNGLKVGLLRVVKKVDMLHSFNHHSKSST